MLAACIIVSLFILLFVILIVICNFLYNIALTSGGIDRLPKGRFDSNEYVEPSLRTEAKQWWNRVPIEPMGITSRDGLALQGYYIENETPSGKLVILAHGYNGSAMEMAAYAKAYYEMGFNIFAPDNRAHGKSEGKVIGMGWLDKDDYLQWIEHLLKSKNNEMEIILHGESMGGAAVSILSGAELPPNVKGIISDCAYDSVKNELSTLLGGMFRLPSFPIIPLSSLICKLRAGYFFGEADVAAQVAACRIPILFIHGESDTFVPFPMVHTLYNAANPSLRDLWTVPGAQHGRSIIEDTEGYLAHMKAFADSVLSSQRSGQASLT